MATESIMYTTVLVQMEIISEFELTKDTPFLALTGKLWVSYVTILENLTIVTWCEYLE